MGASMNARNEMTYARARGSRRPIGRGLCCTVSALALAGALTGGVAQAEQTTDGAKPKAAKSTAVQEVTVTARTLEATLPEQLSKTGVKVDVISNAAIRDGGYVDVAQSLQALSPGLFILPKNGPFDYVDVSLNGSATQDVLWLVDSVRINNRLYAGTTPLDTIPSGVVDHIEVLSGGEALFYGTQALAGAVNIVTKPFSSTPDGSLTLAGDTNNSEHVDAYFRDGFGKSQFVVYGSADYSKGYHTFRPQDYQPSATDRNRGYDNYTLGGKFQYSFSERLQASATYQHTIGDLDYASPYRVAKNVNSRKEDLATVKIDYDVTDNFSTYIKGYYHNWHTTYDTYYNSLTTPGTLDVLYQDAFWGYRDYGLNALGKWTLKPGIEAYFGYDLQKYGGRDEVLVIAQQDEMTQAGFAQLHLTPDLIPHLNLAAGVRYNAPNVGKSTMIWNVSGKYDLPMGLYVRGEVGTNFRLPSAEELFANDPLDERGNAQIKPEHSIGVNASIGGRFMVGSHALNWELIGFARNITDLIDYASYDAVTQQDVFGNVPGTERVRGGEAQIDAALSDAFTWNANYTYNSSKDASGVQQRRVPKSLLKSSIDYHPGDIPFGATLSVVYTGAVADRVAGASIPYGGYTVVDLSGRYFLDMDHHQIFSVSIQNLFDEKYGRPGKGCADNTTDGDYDCSLPYVYVNLGLPRTLRASYTVKF